MSSGSTGLTDDDSTQLEMAARGQAFEVDKADTLKLLHSTLVTSKGGIPVDKLNRKFAF